MNDELLPYYERELLFVRRMAQEFAEQYPQRASALKLTHAGCDDPHVERILEAFALIAGRIQRKIDDEFPEITQALLDVLYPHLLRPVPSMAIAQFEVDREQAKSPTGHLVPRGSITYTEPAGGIECRFRTAYPVRLFPVGVRSAGFSRAANLAGGISGPGAPYALRIELETWGMTKFSSLELRDLRFHLGGDRQAAYWIYESLFTNVRQVLVRYEEKGGRYHSQPLPPDSIREVGFGRDEAVLPYAATSFQGYRLLQEYFCFPQKFLFFDLTGLETVPRPQSDRLEIVILLSEFEREERPQLLESAVGVDTFQLGCTPVVNLFEQCSEPIRVSHTRPEYPVIPDVHAPLAMEVYSINRVVSVTPYAEEPKEYYPFYSLRHDDMDGEGQAFWYATRRASERSGDAGTDVYLSLVDPNFKPTLPATE
ncbi:MAG: type VI secretion system baseplate subunit TssF, partial [Acidobacteria bacterium]|nr:type VI secretion system baseplate subunit TssF [Acidobacteriota bacterium]